MLTTRTHHENVLMAFGLCARTEAGRALAVHQAAAHVSIAGVSMTNELIRHGVLIQGLGDGIIEWLVGFSIKLRLCYANEIDLSTAANENTILHLAFPEMAANRQFENTKDPKAIALRMLFIIRLYYQEITDMIEKLPPPPQAPKS